jgi:hypothetical protein
MQFRTRKDAAALDLLTRASQSSQPSEPVLVASRVR